MKHATLGLAALLSLSVGFGSQEGKAEDPLARFQRLSSPGPHHAHLAAFAGSWDAKMRVAHLPEKEGPETKATVEARMILDGRFLEIEIRSEGTGKGMTVRHLLGYDNARERYTQIVLSNQSTAVSAAAGACAEDGKSIRVEALVEVPGSAARMTYRTVYRRAGEKEFAIDTFMPDPQGKEFLMSELVCTRR